MSHTSVIFRFAADRLAVSGGTHSSSLTRSNARGGRGGAARLLSHNWALALTVALVCSMMAAMCGCGFQLNALPSNALRVSPGAVTFGSVLVGQTVVSSLDVVNVSAVSVVIAEVSTGGLPFSVSSTKSTPISIPAFGSHTFRIAFKPDQSMQYSGQLTIRDAAARQIAQIPINGAGTAADTPQLTLSSMGVSFGSVAVNSASTQAVTLTSTGTVPVTINAVTPAGVGFTVLGASFPVTLNPEQAVTMQIQFKPTTAGAATGQLAISSNSSGGGTAVVTLSGTGLAATSPKLSVSAASLSFGSVAVNSASTQAVTLTSTGTAPLTISAATLRGVGFTVSGASFPVTLNPEQAMMLQIQFKPTAAGAVTGQLAISSNSTSGSPALVGLSGTGIETGSPPTSPKLSVSAANLSFGSVGVNSASAQAVTLTSTGTASVTISAATLAGVGFTVSGASFPVTLNPEQAMMLQIQFKPTAAGAVTGQLAISSNSSGGSLAMVALSGTGTSSATLHAIDLSWNAPKGPLDQLAGYNIYRSSSGDSFQLLNLTPDRQTTYVDSAVESGTTYTYMVKSVDLSGAESDPSDQTTVTMP